MAKIHQGLIVLSLVTQASSLIRSPKQEQGLNADLNVHGVIFDHSSGSTHGRSASLAHDAQEQKSTEGMDIGAEHLTLQEFEGKADTFVQIYSDFTSTSVSSIEFRKLRVILFLVILGTAILTVLSCIILFFCQRSQSDDSQLDPTILDLHADAERCISQIKRGDWRSTLTEFRNRRQYNFNKDHPLYTTIEAHIGEPGVQTQLQDLFTKLNEGEQMLVAGKLEYMLSNLHLEIKRGFYPIENVSLTLTDYEWLLKSTSEKQFSSSDFVSIFALLLAVLVQAKTMTKAEMQSTLAENQVVVWQLKFEYYVKHDGQEVLRASFEHEGSVKPVT